MLPTISAGCVRTETKLVEGTYFHELNGEGTANISGSDIPVKGIFRKVYLIHEDSLVEMLRQR